MEYLLYGLAKGETEAYMEDLLLVTTDRTNIEKVKALATEDGFHSFRETTYNGEAPDFARVIR